MKRLFFHLLSFVLFVFLYRPCYAQDVSAAAYQKVVAENIDLIKQIQDRELEVKALQDAIKKSESFHQKELDSTKRDYENQLKAAQSDLAKITRENQKTQEALDKAKDDIVQLRNSLRKDDYDKAIERVQQLEKELDELKKLRDSLAADNQNLNNVKLEIIKQKEKDFQKLALSPFSQLSAESMQNAISECQVFEKELKGTIDMLSRAQVGKCLYDKSEIILSGLSSRTVIDQMRSKLNSRIDMNVDTPDQINELKDLRAQLTNYKKGITEYQAIIEVFNSDKLLTTFRESDNKRQALDQIEKDLKEDGMEESFTIINQTPVLKNHFDLFLQHMREDPISIPSEQTEIQNL